MKYSAFLLNYYGYRQPYLNRIVGALRGCEKPPSEILIWHNRDRRDWGIPGCKNFFSPINYGCQARLFAGLLCSEKTVYCQDNDLLVRDPELLVEGFEQLERSNSLVGLFGRHLDFKALRPYLEGEALTPTTFLNRHSVVLGRVFVTSRQLFLRAEVLRQRLNLPPAFRTDDILLSAVAKTKILPRQLSWEGFPEHSIGLSHEVEQHYRDRDWWSRSLFGAKR